MGCCGSKDPPPKKSPAPAKATSSKPKNAQASNTKSTAAVPAATAAAAATKATVVREGKGPSEPVIKELEMRVNSNNRSKKDVGDAAAKAAASASAVVTQQPRPKREILPGQTFPLHDAARDGDAKRCKKLLAVDKKDKEAPKVKLAAMDADGMTPLHRACAAAAAQAGTVAESSGNSNNKKGAAAGLPDWKAVVDLLIANGAEIDARSDGGAETADATALLLLAATERKRKKQRKEGQEPEPETESKTLCAVAESLASAGADLNATNRDGVTPLLGAALEGRASLVALLVGKGARADMADYSRGFEPLHGAVLAGSFKTTRVLLEKGGAVVDRKDKESGQTPLSLALRLGGRWPLAESLLAAGASVEARDEEGNTPLHFAALRHDDRAVRALLAKGADAEAENYEGDAPLLMICREETRDKEGRGLKVARLLVDEHGASASIRGAAGRTSLFWPSKRGDEAVVRFLLEKGVEAGARDEDGETALHSAKGVGVAKALISKGGKWLSGERNGQGETPLFNAVRRGDPQLVSFLLSPDGGASDPNAAVASAPHLSPLTLAVVGESAEVARALLDAGADPDGGRGAREGERPIDLAADLEMVGLLLGAGAAPGGSGGIGKD